MASPGGPHEQVRTETPAVLRDECGTAILPAERLPGVDFGAHRADGTDGGAGEKAEPQDNAESSFTPRQGQSDSVKPPAIKRTRTAPMENTRRPNAPAPSRTRSRVMRPRQGNDAFQYTFDPMSSDSDSTLSGDEKEAPPRSKHTHGEKEAKEQQGQKAAAKEGRSYSRFRIGNDLLKTKGRVSKQDGRLNISMNETANHGYLAKALGQTIQHHLDLPHRREQGRKSRRHAADHPSIDADAESIASALRTKVVRPRLNIVIIVIGSRGDIQPFLKIGKILRHEYGHRVRIATHPVFRDFVEKETDLEFFSVGGDPSELMAFMVKNPGLVPSLQTVRGGEIQRRRKGMGEMFEGMWRACTSTTDDEKDMRNLQMMGDREPFVADAIIANPPSMAHVHIAERLGVPLHIMFTFPYSPTQAFPHPLANIKAGKSNVDANYVNFMSYPLVEMMTWSGLGDIVNKFRQRVLGLEPVSSLWAPGALYRMKVPYTYMWSPSLIPKPSDWGPEIDISGFVFLDLASKFKPPEDLAKFLDAGEPPVYIGFGSIVVDDPNMFTDMIFKATKIAGVRALVNKGWGGLGQSNEGTPDNIFMLSNTPHDWLFPKCSAVVHHGGAGTTAIGLKLAKPTMIVPFFGDQAFWGARVSEAKAGAHECISWKHLTAEKLAEGIKQCLTKEAQQNVQKLADGMAKEGDGAVNACKSFHRSLPLVGRHNMRCSILEDRVAVWSMKHSSLRLSSLAAELLMAKGKINPSDLKLLRVYQWNDFDGPGEPVTGTVGAVTDSLYGIGSGVGMVPVRMAQHLQKHAEHQRKKLAAHKRKEQRAEEKRQRKAGESEEQAPTHDARPVNTRGDTTLTVASTLSADPAGPLALELAQDFGEGFKRSGYALLTMPNDLHVAIAQGFHNAPRLWGDATVRKPVRITGFKTGCLAARREFTYGIYDAFTGLVTQPVGGFKDGDTVIAKLSGFGTGVCKGIGGFVLKNISACISPPAYAGKGLIVWIEKKTEANGPGSKASIRRARLIEGQLAVSKLRASDDPADRARLQRAQEEVNEGWAVYEDVWSLIHRDYSDIAGRWRLKREKRRWADAGALESTRTAHRALDVTQRGGSLEHYFSRRKKEIEIAKLSRAPAMEQPASYETEEDVLPNGRKTSDAEDKVEADKIGTEASRSESTYVATLNDDRQASVVSAATAKLSHADTMRKLANDPRPAVSRTTTI